jgi:hypothetical protein
MSRSSTYFIYTHQAGDTGAERTQAKAAIEKPRTCKGKANNEEAKSKLKEKAKQAQAQKKLGAREQRRTRRELLRQKSEEEEEEDTPRGTPSSEGRGLRGARQHQARRGEGGR